MYKSNKTDVNSFSENNDGHSEYDVIVVGTGAAGCFAALNIDENKNVLVITKRKADESDSYLAQGGICVLNGDDDYDAFFEDTMKAGHFENDPESVKVMIDNSRGIIKNLIELGVEFDRDEAGYFFTKEGAHSHARIMYHRDMTGKEITRKLIEAIMKRKNITVFEHTTMVDILVENDGGEPGCCGMVVELKDGTPLTFKAKDTILATGGIGGNYEHSTNYSHLTGDSLDIAKKRGIQLRDLDYVQIHPTSFYTGRNGERQFLISESVRGEGAILLDKNLERFTDELQARDTLTEAIHAQMEKDGTKHVWLSMKGIEGIDLKERFPTIYENCLKEGIDITKDLIPVVPAQHYFMGGISIDTCGRTSMRHLYAVGETACNGVHGRNRLASNSLLESLVFSKRAAEKINKE